MNYIYDAERYALRESEPKVESLFVNDIHRDTGIYVFPFHEHPDFLEVSLVIEGSETIEFRDASYNAGTGDIIIKNAGTLHQETAREGGNLREVSIGISGVHVRGFRENCLIGDDVVPVFSSGEMSGVLVELFYTIDRLYKESITTFAAAIHLALRTLLSLVLVTADQNARMKERKKSRTNEQMQEILDYIDENFCSSISLDDIAKKFYISPYYLTRKFKSEFGYSVNQYIQNRRLGAAEQKLAFGDTPIKEIAEECGFSGIKYFYSVFKTKTGHTPNEFRCLLNPQKDE